MSACVRRHRTALFAAALLPFAAGVIASAPATAQIVTEVVTYDVGGETFEGYVARNRALEETRGTVVIIHDWDGPNDYEHRRADMLAALGYTAFAADVYGMDLRPQGPEESAQASRSVSGDREVFRERLEASLQMARDLEGAGEGIVVIGYCFGGGGVLELARAGAEVDGFVSFHGSLGLPEGQDYEGVTAPILIQHGSADPSADMESLATLFDDLNAAGVAHRADIYGGILHSFTVWESSDYDVDADQRSWAAFLDFLQERLN